MKNPLAIGAPRVLSIPRSRRMWHTLLLLTTLGIATGCGGGGGGGAKNEVTGKVTLGDKTVVGNVVFVYSDGKEVTGPIDTSGVYSILDAQPGSVKIYLKTLPGAGPVAGAPKVAGTPEMPKDPMSGGQASTGGVPPPAKYTSAASSGLTYDVKAGKQTYDIPLKP